MKRNRMSVKRVRRSKRKNTRYLTIKKRNKRVKSYRMRGGQAAAVPAVVPADLTLKQYPGPVQTGQGAIENNQANNVNTAKVNVALAGGASSTRRKGSRGSRRSRGSRGSRRSRGSRGKRNKGKQKGGSAWLDKLYAYTPPTGMMGPVPQPSQSEDANRLIRNAANIHVAGQSDAQYDGNVCPVK